MAISMNITNFSSIPSNKVLITQKIKTKEIYILRQEITDFVFNTDMTYDIITKNDIITKIRAINSKQELYFTKENERGFPLLVRIKENNNEISNLTLFSQTGNPSYDAIVIKSDTPLEFTEGIDKGIYCVPYTPPPEIIPVDKVPSTTSLNDITNYINKTTESIKSCKSYIAYVINNKGGSATDTETLESLIDKLNNAFQISPDNPPPPLDLTVKPFKLKLSAEFYKISSKLQEINNLLKVSSDNLKTIMDANSLLYEPTDNFSTLVKKLNNEPINFLLEGTKVRDILRKHMGTMIYAPDAGATYNDLMFTNSLPSDAQDLKEDLSQKQDGSILLLKKSISDGGRTYDTYYIYSNKKIYANKNSSYMFNLGVNYFNDIYFNNFYGEYIENASHLFDYVTYSNASAVYVTLNKFENVILNNLVNIDYMFNDCAIKLNRSITITNKIKTYNNFYSKFNSYQESYGSITLNYIDNESKKIAESIISEVNDNFVKLGTLVTQ